MEGLDVDAAKPELEALDADGEGEPEEGDAEDDDQGEGVDEALAAAAPLVAVRRRLGEVGELHVVLPEPGPEGVIGLVGSSLGIAKVGVQVNAREYGPLAEGG